MEALFLKLLNLSLTAGWLILAIVVLRLIFRKAPRWVFCLLWGLAALRLVCPVTVESVVSLIPSAQPIPTTIVYQAAPAIDSGIPAVNQVVNPVLSTAFTPTPAASVNPLQVVTAVAAWVWLAGLILMAVYALISYLLLRRRVATATLLRENIKQSERVDSPFVLGLFRPTVYLPYSMEEADMGHVIAHERAHIRRGDHWWKPLGFLILAVYWFHPLVWVAYILFCRDMELACDEKVASHMAHEERQAYSTALLHCGVRRRTVAACPLAFGEVGVKSRVKSVMNYKKPAFWVVLIALVACIVVAVCFLTVPKEDGPHTLEVTGLPAPESGEDPYAKLEPAERAAAFLANADMMSYEFAPLVMHGQYVIPTMAATPAVHEVNGQTITTNNLQPILELLHNFDLTALTPIDVTVFDRQDQISGLIHVGDARCRMAIWYDTAKYVDHQGTVGSALVFTFADGTMCAFDGGNLNSYITDPWEAIEQAGSARNYAFSTDITTESNVTVTELATGERKNLPAYTAAYVECIFENTPLLSEQVKSEAEFPWKIEIPEGSTYWYNPEQKLLVTENNKVYAIGGFETNTSNDSVQSMNDVIELMIPGFVLSPFGYEVTADPTSGTVTIKPPPDNSEPGIPAPESGEDPYADLEPAERAAAFLNNADALSYELGAISMYGSYIVPVMEYVPPALARPDDWPAGVSPTYMDRSGQILELLHGFDLSALKPVEIKDFEVFDSSSGVLHVGDARCRMALWYESSPAEDSSAGITLVFTFSDGTMCAFDGGNAADNRVTNIMQAIDFAASERAYILYSKGTGGNVTVTKLSTGERRALHPAASAYVECIFKNTPRLSDPVKSEAEFPWKIELQNGDTYWYNPEQNLLMAESNTVYAIGGFENQEGSFTMESLISGLVTNGFEES